MSVYEVLDTLFECPALRGSCGPSLQCLHTPGAQLFLAPFLDLAVGLTQASNGQHLQRIVHKQILPAYIVVNTASGQSCLIDLCERVLRRLPAPAPRRGVRGLRHRAGQCAPHHRPAKKRIWAEGKPDQGAAFNFALPHTDRGGKEVKL
jgi:hypothetical protein